MQLRRFFFSEAQPHFDKNYRLLADLDIEKLSECPHIILSKVTWPQWKWCSVVMKGLVKPMALSRVHNSGTLFPQVSSHLTLRAKYLLILSASTPSIGLLEWRQQVRSWYSNTTSTDNDNLCVLFLFFKDLSWRMIHDSSAALTRTLPLHTERYSRSLLCWK